MSVLFGAIGMADSELPFVTVEGQELMWQETQRVFAQWNMDMEAATQLFVQMDTENHKERYELPGGGDAQEEDNSSGANESASVKRSGSWDVAYPLNQIGDSLSYDDIGLAHLTLGQYDAHIQTVLNRNNNATFTRILKPIFHNTNQTFTDNVFGALTLVPLANQDGTLYPPVYGSTAEAEEQFYVGTAYAESAISNTNNPFITLRDKLEPHFGFPQGGSPIVALVNKSTVPYARALAGFDEYTNRYDDPGDNVTTLTGLPALPAGMRIVGVESVASVVIVEWPRMPSGYIIGLHLDAPKPLKRRKDMTRTGLQPGLQLVTKTVGQPYQTSRWRNRQGFGVGNRIGGAVIQLSGTSSYSIPSGY